ncbi:MAG: hypothetical protein CSB24_00450 [Deltaproteobacteria bacterium]|nr:MAG: hypothetical protein CSB24_00450 [Deltaproteobacteria bacterium]
MTTRQHISTDLLAAVSSTATFEERVKRLRLSSRLEEKAVLANRIFSMETTVLPYLLPDDEKELGSEVLLQRHKFTDLVFRFGPFRQAAISVIQNIYLFRNRKIFFGSGLSGEQERQEALLLLTDKRRQSVPLARAFQHNILARIWGRIISIADENLQASDEYAELLEIIENINTLRNIYMVLTTRLVAKLTGNISSLYRQSISRKDAAQIGSFGVARAAYRYHHSCGYRFSTYAASWVKKEIQRQALDGRLIKISPYLLEKIAKNVEDDADIPSVKLSEQSDFIDLPESDTPADILEKRLMLEMLIEAVDKLLPGKGGDIIRRRYGLPPYEGEQSIIDIAGTYGVTRGSIYQLEAAALKKLADYLQKIV